MKRIFIATLGVYLLNFSAIFAASCDNITTQIHKDINMYSDTIKNQHLPWMNLVWLQKTLGSGSKLITDYQIHYRWNCANTDAWLDAAVDNNNHVMNISGQYSTADSAGNFSADLSQSQQPVTQPAKTVATVKQPLVVTQPKDDNAGIQQSQADFKEWFNANLQNNNEIMNYALQSITHYFTELRHCTPGTYKYAISNMHKDKLQPAYFLAMSTIQGIDHDVCAVDYAVKLNNRVQLTKCKFSEGSLSWFTDENAKAENASIINKSTDYLMMERMRKECKRSPMPEDDAALAQLQNYLKNFRQCIPGTYKTMTHDPQYADYQLYQVPLTFIDRVSVISGMTDNKCIIKATSLNDGKLVETSCAYSQDSLDFLANEKTRELENELTGKSNKSFLDVDQAFIDKSMKAINECTPAAMPF